MIENRAVGIKSREVYEAPAAIALIEAHRALEDLVLTKDELRTKRALETRWTELVYDGLWFSPLRDGDRRVRRRDAGARRPARCALELRPARPSSTGRRSEHALYAETLASYADGETFPHEAAEGFIRIASLRDASCAAETRPDAAAAARPRLEWSTPMTLWCRARVGTRAARARGRGVPAGRRRRAAPVRLRGDAHPRASGSPRPGC